MKKLLQRLYDRGEFDQTEAYEIMLNITNGVYSHEEVAAFLMGLNMRELVINELIGFRKAMLDQAILIDLSEFDTIDIVGTGGDGKNTFNISTCTSVVVAGAGYKVAKHGSYASSSVSGSADVLLELGVKFTNQESTLKRSLAEANLCFLHAPLFHPAMKHVVPIRRALGIKTVFNILGPLINPSQSSYANIGVYSSKLATVFVEVLRNSSLKNYKIVHSLDGYDEVSLTGDTLIVSREGEKKESPSYFKSNLINPDCIFGGSSVEEAAQLFKAVLENNSTSEQKEVVIANAMLAILTIDPKLTVGESREKAKHSIESGAAKRCLNKLIEINNSY